MGKYSKFDDPVVDQYIENQLQRIVGEIRTRIVNVNAIILTGGFARGEGSVYFKEPNQVIPLKDYDLVVITDEQISSTKYKQLIDSLNSILGISSQWYEGHAPGDFHINIEFISCRKLRKLPPDLSNYELKKNGLILHGENLLHLIPLTSARIARVSGIRILCNKLIGLLENNPWDSEITPDSKKGQSLIYECAKTYVEICTALSLAGNFYAPTYEERASLFDQVLSRKMPDLQEKIPDLTMKVKTCTSYKLKPISSPFENGLASVWMETKKDLLTVLGYMIKTHATKGELIGKMVNFDLFNYLKINFYSEYISYYLKDKRAVVRLVGPLLSRFIQAHEYLKFQIKNGCFRRIITGIFNRGYASPRFYVYVTACLLLSALMNVNDAQELVLEEEKLKMARKFLNHVCVTSFALNNDLEGWLLLARATVSAQKNLLLAKRKKTTL
ncbi:MAG: nucleotidyltransferase domain-containing protein [Candidatus Helarchaeota archaeon]